MVKSEKHVYKASFNDVPKRQIVLTIKNHSWRLVVMVEKILSRSVRLMFAGGLVLGMQAAGAQEVMQKVEVTGSRIPTVYVDGPSPVTVLGSKEIKADGVRNVESLLNNLPQVFADQGGNVVNGSTGTATVNLRGLGADRTLVLVNGRRLPMGSPTNTAADLNQIPAPLIKRVEVLTGGASAIYGSDAVAGVVNFIMNDKFEGVQIEANHSFFNHQQQGAGGVADIVAGRSATNPKQFQVPGNKTRDGESTDASLLMGANFDGGKGNATLFFNYKKDEALLQSERDFSACSLSSNAAGFRCGGSGTSATGTFITDNGNFTTADSAGTARPSTANDQYNFGPLNYYQRPSERYGFNAAGKYEIAEHAKLYTEFSFHDDRTVAQIAPGGIFGEAITAKFDNPLLSTSWKNALGLANPGDSAEVVLLRRNVEGGGRASEFRNTSFRSVIGVKGEIGKWNYDAFMQTAKVIYSQNEKNYFSTQRILKAMDVVNVAGKATCQSVVNGTDTACVPYNPWSLGGVTPAQLAYLQTPGSRQGSTQQSIQGASLSADLGDYGMKLPMATNGVGVAFGLEHRSEKLELQTDSLTAAGDLSGSGGPTPGLTGSLSVKEVFGEVRLPLIEGKKFADLLSLNGSFRHSEYDSSIKTNTYGLGIEWAPVKEARLRGSYQQAIRAANLVELFQAQGNNLYDNDEDPCAGAKPKASLAACQRTGVTAAQYGNIQDSPAGQYNYLVGGNPNLSPEKAKSFTFGLVMTPMRNLSMTIDYFNIKVEDTISIIDPTTSLANCLATGEARFCNLISRDRLGTLWLFDEGRIIGTNQNIGGTKTSGVDLALSYTHKLPTYGSLGLSLAGTYLKTFETEEIKGEGSYDCVGLYGPNKCGSPNPEWRHKARLTWTSPWAFDVAMTWRYMSEVVLQTTSSNPLLSGTVNSVDRTLAAQNYIDLGASWNATKQLTISGGINNLFDRDPPITSQLATGGGNGNTYPSVYDALGRRIFLNATYKF
jgi:iron complex outermembrane receptor protein